MLNMEIEAEVACEYCDAAKGDPCVDVDYGFFVRPHPSRIEDAAWHITGEQEEPPMGFYSWEDFRGCF